MTPARLEEIRRRFSRGKTSLWFREHGEMLDAIDDLLAHVDALEAENRSLRGGGDDVDAAIAFGMATIRNLEKPVVPKPVFTSKGIDENLVANAEAPGYGYKSSVVEKRLDAAERLARQVLEHLKAVPAHWEDDAYVGKKCGWHVFSKERDEMVAEARAVLGEMP